MFIYFHVRYCSFIRYEIKCMHRGTTVFPIHILPCLYVETASTPLGPQEGVDASPADQGTQVLDDALDGNQQSHELIAVVFLGVGGCLSGFAGGLAHQGGHQEPGQCRGVGIQPVLHR